MGLGKRHASIPCSFNLCLLLVSLILCLVLWESALRLFPRLLPPGIRQRFEVTSQSMGVSHPYIGHLHTPNITGTLQGKDFKATHHTDAYGFRNVWPWPAAADIVVVGDSFVFGYGVMDQQAWPAVLNHALPQYCTLNLGLIGAGPEQYLRVYETFGRQMQPRVLLIGMLMANDGWDAVMFDHWLALGATGNYMKWRDYGRYIFTPRDPIEGLKNLGRRYSYLYNLAQGAYKTWRWGGLEILPFADGSQLQLVPSQLGEATARAQPDQPGFDLILKALTRLHTLATANNTHVLVIFQPGKEEVYLPLLGKPAVDPGAALHLALDQQGIDTLDLTNAFRQHAQAGERLFFEVDGHPNQYGYKLIAQEVLAHLKQHATTYGLTEITAEQ